MVGYKKKVDKKDVSGTIILILEDSINAQVSLKVEKSQKTTMEEIETTLLSNLKIKTFKKVIYNLESQLLYIKRLKKL